MVSPVGVVPVYHIVAPSLSAVKHGEDRPRVHLDDYLRLAPELLDRDHRLTIDRLPEVGDPRFDTLSVIVIYDLDLKDVIIGCQHSDRLIVLPCPGA